MPQGCAPKPHSEAVPQGCALRLYRETMPPSPRPRGRRLFYRRSASEPTSPRPAPSEEQGDGKHPSKAPGAPFQVKERRVFFMAPQGRQRQRIKPRRKLTAAELRRKGVDGQGRGGAPGAELQTGFFKRKTAADDTLSAAAWSWWTDLNPRPADYKSAALPAELHQRICEKPCRLGSARTAGSRRRPLL